MHGKIKKYCFYCNFPFKTPSLFFLLLLFFLKLHKAAKHNYGLKLAQMVHGWSPSNRENDYSSFFPEYSSTFRDQSTSAKTWSNKMMKCEAFAAFWNHLEKDQIHQFQLCKTALIRQYVILQVLSSAVFFLLEDPLTDELLTGLLHNWKLTVFATQQLMQIHRQPEKLKTKPNVFLIQVF